MLQKTPLGVVCGSDPKDRSLRALWTKALPLEFEDVRFFDPEPQERGGSRAIRAALDSGVRVLLVSGFEAIPLNIKTKCLFCLDATIGQKSWIQKHRGPGIAMKREIGHMRRLADEGLRFLCMSRLAEHGVAEEYRAKLDRIFLVSPPVDTDLFAPFPNRKREGLLRVLAVGDSFEADGEGALLRLSADKGLPVRWDFVVPGSHPNSANVVFHGDVDLDGAEMAALTGACDLLLVPGRTETFPFIALRAMASGIPAIVRNIGASAEVVAHGSSGFVLHRADEKDIKETLFRYIAEPDLLAKHGDVGSKTVRRENSLAVHAARVRRAFESE